MTPTDDDDELFDKLDQLISRHQGRAPPHGTRPPGVAPAPPVPTLTDAVDRQRPTFEPEIPVLEEAIEPLNEAALQWVAAGDRRRQLQVALYLRLRQRLDREIEALAQGRTQALDARLMRVVQALRDALPAIVRDSVDQALGGKASGVGGQSSVPDDGADDH
jgi:hypothetical protein